MAGFPHPSLPLELTRASLLYLDVSTLLSLASTSRSVLRLLDAEAGLWSGWADRRMLYFGAPDSSSSNSSAAISIPSSSSTSLTTIGGGGAGGAGGPHPFAALFPEGGVDEIDFVSSPSRVSVAAFDALRTKVLEARLAPLLDVCDDDGGGRGGGGRGGGRGGREGGKSQPCLISTYFQAFDVLVTLRADDAIDALLQAQRRRLLLTSSSSSSPPFSFLSPLAVLLALHLLYRSLPPSSSSSPSSCCAWRRRLLSCLANGPFQGLAVVAFWTMGSHNPQNGFRARDVLKTEKLDLRRVACLLLAGDGKREGGRKGGERIEETEEEEEEEEERRHGVAVERTIAKLESLRGMMPTVTLSPAVVYVGGVEDDNSMCENAQGFFALSSSPPRR